MSLLTEVTRNDTFESIYYSFQTPISFSPETIPQKKKVKNSSFLEVHNLETKYYAVLFNPYTPSCVGCVERKSKTVVNNANFVRSVNTRLSRTVQPPAALGRRFTNDVDHSGAGEETKRSSTLINMYLKLVWHRSYH